MRQRAELLAHLHKTTSQSNLPEMGKQIAYKATRDGVVARLPAPAVPQSIAVDLALLGHDDQLRRAVARSILTTAQPHQAQTLDRLRPVPGSGAILSWGLLYAIHASTRFPRGHDFLAYGRRVKGTRAAAGKRYGTSGTQLGHAPLQWAFSEAAVLVLRAHPAGPKSLTTLEKQHGSGKAWTLVGQQRGRTVYWM
jgi:transposase